MQFIEKKFLGFEISKMGMMCNSCEKLKMFALEAVFHYFKIMNMYDHYNNKFLQFPDLVIL